MTNVFIIGSCVTRDAFELRTHGYNLTGYVARTSFASAFFEPPFPLSLEALDPERAMKSEFQRRMVKYDLSKDLRVILERVAKEHRPLVIVDLIDERFQLLSYGGSIATYSAELQKTNIVERFPETRVIKPYSEEHTALWVEGIRKFKALVEKTGLKVVVNKAYWATKSDEGKAFSEQWVGINNAGLKQMYDILDRECGFDDIRYPGMEFISSSQHKWGVSPFHYQDAVYERFMEGLREAQKKLAG